jgi:hypothetical protein
MTTTYKFYATSDDIQNILHTVEANYELQYIKCGLFDSPARPVFYSFSSLPELGLALTGQSILEPTFLIMFQGIELRVREVSQRRGGNKYAIDQKANPGTVALRPGGIYKDSALIAGMVGTIHSDEKAVKLMKAFSSALHRDFTKIKSYLVGLQARGMYFSGMRLTHSVKAPVDFNLSV